MGLPAEQFESIEMYMPRRAFYVIEGGLTADTVQVDIPDNIELDSSDFTGATIIPVDFRDRYRDLHKYVRKIGEEFWLSDVEVEFAVEDRLSLMSRATYHLKPKDADIKEVEKDIQHLIKQAHLPSGDLAEAARQNSRGRVPDYQGKRDKNGSLPRLGTHTYHEVHDISDVRFAALNALRKDDFAAIEIVRSLEGWRWANEIDLSNDQHEAGRLAFEAYLFSIASLKFLPALGHAATAYLK